MKPKGDQLSVALALAERLVGEKWRPGDPLPSHQLAGNFNISLDQPCPACTEKPGRCPAGCRSGVRKGEWERIRHGNAECPGQACTVYGTCLACMGDAKRSFVADWTRGKVRLRERLYGHRTGPEYEIGMPELLRLLADTRADGSGEQLSLS